MAEAIIRFPSGKTVRVTRFGSHFMRPSEQGGSPTRVFHVTTAEGRRVLIAPPLYAEAEVIEFTDSASKP